MSGVFGIVKHSSFLINKNLDALADVNKQRSCTSLKWKEHHYVICSMPIASNKSIQTDRQAGQRKEKCGGSSEVLLVFYLKLRDAVSTKKSKSTCSFNQQHQLKR